MKKEPFDYNFDSKYVDAVAKYTLQSVYRGALVKTAISGRSYGVMKDLSVVREMVRNTNTIKNIDFDGVFYRLFGYYGAKYDSLMFYAKYLGNHKNKFYKQMAASHFVKSAPWIARIRARSLIGR